MLQSLTLSQTEWRVNNHLDWESRTIFWVNLIQFDWWIFLREKDSQSLIIEFVANLELLPEKNKAEMPSKFLEIENNIRKSLPTYFSILNESNFIPYLINE